MVFFKIWPENFKKTIITRQALKFKLNSLNQTCTSLKSIMQLTRNIFPDSAIFIEKREQKTDCGEKVNFRGKKNKTSESVKVQASCRGTCYFQTCGSIWFMSTVRTSSQLHPTYPLQFRLSSHRHQTCRPRWHYHFRDHPQLNLPQEDPRNVLVAGRRRL